MTTASLRGARGDHATAVARAKARPGVWVRVTVYRASYVASSIASQITRGSLTNIPAYIPGEPIEAESRLVDDGAELWIRWTGAAAAPDEAEELAADPETAEAEARLAQIRRALGDPGSITPRADNHRELLLEWQARAVAQVLGLIPAIPPGVCPRPGCRIRTPHQHASAVGR